MANYSTNEFRSGLRIIMDNDPCIIVENEFVKPGKGQAFNRVRIKNLKSGKTVDKTFKSGDRVPAADVMDTDMQYLYNDGEFWHFMVQDTFEQYAADKNAIAGADLWLKEQDVCQVTLWNNEPLIVLPPNFVELESVETDPGLRGDTASGGVKPAKLSTGAVVLVPRTNSPNRVGVRQLVLDVGDMAGLVGGVLGQRANPRQDEEQTAIAARRAHPEIAAASRAFDPGQSRAQFRLVFARAMPGLAVMVADRGEIREILAQDIVDHCVPSVRIVLVIEVALVQDHVGPLLLDHPKDGKRSAL